MRRENVTLLVILLRLSHHPIPQKMQSLRNLFRPFKYLKPLLLRLSLLLEGSLYRNIENILRRLQRHRRFLLHWQEQ